MSLALAVGVVLGFAWLLHGLGLPERAAEVTRRSREGLSILGDPSLDDDEKERGLRRLARRLFALLGILVGGSALALAVPLAAVWALERAGVASLEAVLGVLERPDFLAATAVVGLGGWLLLGRARSP